LWQTRFLPLIIKIDDKGNVYIYIDRVHAVHADGKEYSGLYMMMDKGAIINVSKKLGLVTNSLMETEVVSYSEWFPKYTWFRYFRMA